MEVVLHSRRQVRQSHPDKRTWPPHTRIDRVCRLIYRRARCKHLEQYQPQKSTQAATPPESGQGRLARCGTPPEHTPPKAARHESPFAAMANTCETGHCTADMRAGHNRLARSQRRRRVVVKMQGRCPAATRRRRWLRAKQPGHARVPAVAVGVPEWPQVQLSRKRQLSTEAKTDGTTQGGRDRTAAAARATPRVPHTCNGRADLGIAESSEGTPWPPRAFPNAAGGGGFAWRRSLAWVSFRSWWRGRCSAPGRSRPRRIGQRLRRARRFPAVRVLERPTDKKARGRRRKEWRTLKP